MSKAINGSSNKTKTTFLFGAGAAIPFNGPTTHDLTQIALKIGPNIRDEEKTITQYIFDKLLDAGFSEDEVNFETLIAVLEELYIFYANTHNNISSFYSVFLNGDKFKHKVVNPNHLEGTVRMLESGATTENEIQEIIKELVGKIIIEINAEIHQYAYHTKSSKLKLLSTNEEDKKGLIENFQKWIQSIKSESSIRIYTLNYDSIFKAIMQEVGINLFDGFNETDNLNKRGPDLYKIISDSEEDIHYNLHGSIYWRFTDIDDWEHEDNIPFIVKGYGPSLPEMRVFKGVEKGKPLLLSSIISGYQKVQRISIPPLREMHNAFEKDCMESNKLIIVGYSLGDDHINRIIQTAFFYNENLKIEIVDPSDLTNSTKSMDYKILREFDRFSNPSLPKNTDDDKVKLLCDDRIILHNKYLEDYLSCEIKMSVLSVKP
ncbi:SIR2 family protein [Flammeovirga sp. EKP202]|uniref:SIR2 family protein n=1 Tax=Flammeovirga sp. EKP202 TaxID=2770592 RepID=UPI00165F42F2|nr:SIR2 family protein [Flammeovirga sp. EKP202]MBD0402828.1 SIR2 family protein [Flammeovirga sp. EKP202]